MAAPRRPAVTSGAGPRRRRVTKWSPRTSKAGLSGEKPPSGPCRDTLRTNSAATSPAASSASASPARPARRAARDSWWRSPAGAAASARPLAAATWLETAAHLADHVIPPVPVRQWVISVPKRLRGMLADRPPAVVALTKIFLDEIERLLCAAAGGMRDADAPASARPRLGGISLRSQGRSGRFSHTWANRSSRHHFCRHGARLPTGASSCRSTTS